MLSDCRANSYIKKEITPPIPVGCAAISLFAIHILINLSKAAPVSLLHAAGSCFVYWGKEETRSTSALMLYGGLLVPLGGLA